LFEQETESIISTVLRRLDRKDKESISVREILAEDVPQAVKTFFRADAEALLLGELQAHRKSSRFDFSHPEVQGLQKQINSILILHYEYPLKEFSGRLRDSVHMLMNYLIRPQWTLTGALFEKEGKISSQALPGLLRHFGPYEYLKEIVIQYIEEKKIGFLEKNEFSTLIWKADSGFVRRKKGAELARILAPLYDFFNYPKSNPEAAMPLKALIKYFEDKGLTSAVSRLEGELSQGRENMTMDELGETLEAVRATFGAFETEKTESAENIQAYEQGVERPLPKFKLDAAISEGDKRRFVRKIFKQDEEAFNSALRLISQLRSWKQASKFIDELFIQNDIDPYSSEAKRFIELIFKQYIAAK